MTTGESSAARESSVTRAVAVLLEIMLDEGQCHPLRRRIEAAEQLLDYEAPLEIVEEAKAVLTGIAEQKETLVEYRLEALKLLRKAEARKVVPAKATVRNEPRNIELSRALDIAKRREALMNAGAWPPPEGWCDDLNSPDYAPLPRTEEPVEQDMAEALRNAHLAHMRKVSAKSS